MSDPEKLKKKLAANLVKLNKCFTAMKTADEATFEAMTAHVDELINEQMRIMGLPEDEIIRINQEAETAAEEQINKEMDQTAIAIIEGDDSTEH
jgi:hypothetical protein